VKHFVFLDVVLLGLTPALVEWMPCELVCVDCCVELELFFTWPGAELDLPELFAGA
jgi:hypothetical protein